MRDRYESTKSGVSNLAVVVVLLVAAAALFMYRSGSFRRMIRHSRPENAPQIGYKPVADVTEKVFAEYCAVEGTEKKIKLNTVKTSNKFKVTAMPSAVGTRAFLITPSQYFQFVSADIGYLVKTGLTARTLSGKPCDPFYKNPVIAANAEARNWTVTVKDVNGEGIISLNINGAIATHKVERPRLFPVWKFLQYAQPAEGPNGRGSVFAQGCTVMEKDRTRENDKDCSVMAPNKAQNFCGYRVYGITQRCVWLEVVYYGLSKEIKRREWPDFEVIYDLEGGIATAPKIRFADGTELRSGRYGLPGGDSLEVKDGSILDHRAVLFGYYGPDNNKIADMVAVDLSKPTL